MLVSNAVEAALVVCEKYESESCFRRWIDNHLFWTHRVPTEIIHVMMKGEKK